MLRTWQQRHPSTSAFFVKVRLGHGIFLNDSQRNTIKELKIPMEVCPSCHKKLNWWHDSQPHPVKNIYSLWSDPVVPGTDDELIFGGDAIEESRHVMQLLNASDNDTDESAITQHQMQFRFG